MGLIGRTLRAAKRRGKYPWIAGIALLGAYGMAAALERRTSAVPMAEPETALAPRTGWKFWKHVLVRTYAEFNEDAVLMLAAAVAFYAVLALVPAMTAAVSLYALFSDPSTVENQFNHLQGLMPSGSFTLIKQQIQRIWPEGERFDANLHQAMFEVPGSGKPAGTVVQVMQAGYKIHDRLLRPALVGVAKGGPAAANDAGPGGSVDTTA